MRVPMVPIAAAVLVTGAAAQSGCAVVRLVGGMMQNAEYQKLIEVHPVYTDLEGRSVAIVVDVDLMTRYEHPSLAMNLATNIAYRIQANVADVRVKRPNEVVQWQYATPHHEALPYGEIAEQLDVDRVIMIDVHEYRLHPVGNRFLWEGACTAKVGIIERDAVDPDTFVDQFLVDAAFPKIKGVGVTDGPSQAMIERGLQTEFVQRASGLFYLHLEPKYPDKYRPPPP